MDRFIDINIPFAVSGMLALKSNMDRFIEYPATHHKIFLPL